MSFLGCTGRAFSQKKPCLIQSPLSTLVVPSNLDTGHLLSNLWDSNQNRFHIWEVKINNYGSQLGSKA